MCIITDTRQGVDGDTHARLQVSWQGHDAGGHPVLVVRIGEAIASCDQERGAHFANAIITQVCYGDSRSVVPGSA